MFVRRLSRALAALVVVAAPTVASPQYFGRNKVNWETHDFRIMKAPKFDVYFYPAESLAAFDGARMAERWYGRLSPYLTHTFERRSFLFFADQADFQQNNVTDIESEGTGGVTEGFRERVLLPFTGVAADDDHVIGHELVHVFQYDIANRTASATPSNPGGQGQQPRERTLGLNALPLWLVEGMAEYLSLGRVDANTAMWLRDAARRNDIPTIKQLTNDPRYFPYRYGQALWAYVGGRWGDEAVPRLFRQSLREGFEPAIKRVLGMSADQLSKEWKASILATYQPQLAGRTPPESLATKLVFQKGKRGGEYNISPVISPDGRNVAFFSSRGLFSIDLFIADAETGRIVRQLGSINTPRHYDAMSFISSAGAWSPDGRKLAYVVYREGDQVLEVFDLDRNRMERRIAPEGVGAALDPAWSPDGRYIAFSGLTGGISDIFLYDYQTNGIRKLTSGRYAELQPTWSPDGRTIAFTTDRGDQTNLEQLRFGPMRVATIDVASEAITILPALGAGKAITPQYSPDGRSLFVVGDPDGVSDVYRLDLGSGTYSRVTRVSSGVSGITGLSPAMSVARGTGRMVFSVFDRQGYDIIRLEPAQTVGTPVTSTDFVADGVRLAAAALPPVPPAAPSIVDRYRADATTGLPAADATYAVVPYRAGLKLDYVAPPSVGVSFGGPLGTQLGGGVGAAFSDQLGNHNLQAIFALQGELRDAGAQAIYTNTRRRWNYGIAAGHVPYLTGFAFYDDSTGLAYNEVYQRIYLEQVSLFTQYPFSTTRRLEFALGATRQSYSIDRYRYPLNAFGQPVDLERTRISGPPALNYAQAMAAFVGDYSYFGLTSPVAGARYRVELSPTVGDVTFQSALVDGRRYFYARPVTLAARGIFYGRFGRDAQDRDKFYPLFVGDPQLVRGYDVQNFNPGECLATSTNDCPTFNRLTGSRIAAVSAELRLPFLGPQGFALIPFNFLPVEIAPFADAGLAWSSGDDVRFQFLRGDAARGATAQVPVASAGVSTRINLFGYLIGEIYYAYPFQRPDKGGHFGFQLAPGW